MGLGIVDGGLGLPPERLHVSVFAGDEADGLPADEEAAELWRRFVPENRISRFDKKDNFWEMGATDRVVRVRKFTSMERPMAVVATW